MKVVERPPVVASDPAQDTLLAAKPVFHRALTVGESARAMFGAAERDVERLKALERVIFRR